MTQVDAALSRLDAVQDLLTVRKVFGQMYEKDGVTIIPVAEVRGGAGGGGGEGSEEQRGRGSGTGFGFGVKVRPTGVFVVKEGDVSWMPSVDVTRIVLGGQLVAIAAMLVIRGAIRRNRT